MIKTDFDSRVKIQQIIESQLPEFILDESPKFSEFLKQYYISQEYQSGPTDIIENLDQYLKLDNLLPEVISGVTLLSSNINSEDTTIEVNSTKGFPKTYGLLKIDDEIITYTGITSSSFTGCIRGFSGITNYHSELNYEELVFSKSSTSSHTSNSSITNLSSLFIKEFFNKIKYTLTPGLEGLEFVSDLNVRNFIKESRDLYKSKGTVESFRILFNVLFGETPSVLDLGKFLLKPSDSEYIRRKVVTIDVISGDPNLLRGQTISKSGDPETTASISEVETITRSGKSYNKLLLFVGFDDTNSSITGTFDITKNTKVVEDVTITPLENGTTVITVDSTVGFHTTGSVFYNDREIKYSDKTINQFLNCHVGTGITVVIPKTSDLRSSDTYYGYENGDLSKKVEFRITGVLSDLISNSNNNFNFSVNDELYPLNFGEVIDNPRFTTSSKRQIFANSWIYNVSSRYQIKSYSSNNTIILKSNIDKSSLKKGDIIEILKRNTEIVVNGFENVEINSVDLNSNSITLNTIISSLNPNDEYDIRRKIKKAESFSVPIEYGNNLITSDVQNVYSEHSNYMYVASNSLPSYAINSTIFKYTAAKIDILSYNSSLNAYSILEFDNEVSFFTGDRILYECSDQQITDLNPGLYYVEVLPGNKKIRLYEYSPFFGTDSFITFGYNPGDLPPGAHTFTLYSQSSNVISPQKILKKFNLDASLNDYENYSTPVGFVGMLKNGVEILNYKTNDKIYYGHLDNVQVLNGGENFDVINPPSLEFSSGSGRLQPVINGSVEKVYVDPQDFDVDVLVNVSLIGGNGKGASFLPVIEKTRREIEFDARPLINGGGLDFNNETIYFELPHNLTNGQAIIYDSNNNSPIGIGTFKGSNLDQSKTLKSGATYYTKIINDKTIQLYESFTDYISGINTVGFTTVSNSGIQKFKTELKNTLTEIKVINGGNNYSNRKLKVKPSGISTSEYTINFKNHGFSSGELINYEYENFGIVGLSTFNQYYVLNIDSNSFRLCNAGVGGTDTSNYERNNYVKFAGIGTGYQIFKYPEISLTVNYTSAGIGSTEVRGSIVATPVVRGSISHVYVYEKGSNYGSTLLNIHRRPKITIKNGKDAQFIPLIKNGKIISVKVQYGGSEYYSNPDLKVIGNGVGATLRPIISNNKITEVIVVNGGSGYDQTSTFVRAESSGKNAVLQCNVRELTLNSSYRYGIQKRFYRDPASEVLYPSRYNLQYAICGYSQNIKNNLNDTGSVGGEHSPIIGWSYDGIPIYGPYGYSDPNNLNSSIKKLESGYSQSIVENRPSLDIFPLGYFNEDYKFTNSGDLDECNGRYTKTPEFPDGTYAYFTSIDINTDGEIIGKFPYFIGNNYRLSPLIENIELDQAYDFNNSNLLRNTFPYKVNDEYADYDFFVESNEIVEQKTTIESVSYGSVSSLEILEPGEDYSIGDQAIFSSNDQTGGALLAYISEIKGKNIVDLNTSSTSYQNSLITWENGEDLKITINPYHNFADNEKIIVSGMTSELSSINGGYKIGVTTYATTLEKNVQNYATTGQVTDIYLSHIPENISIGSSIKIENEIFSILNLYPNYGVVKVSRSASGVAHTQTTNVEFLPNSFTINKKNNYFNSKENYKAYFNPIKSIGIGITSGSGISTSYNIGIGTYNIFIPTQSIFIPGHKFSTNQEVFLKKEFGNAISVANTSGESSFNILNSNSERLYVIKKSKDFIGLVTSVGLTTISNGLFFLSSGSDNYFYSIESNNKQVTGTISKYDCTLSISTSHRLNTGDNINLTVKPDLSVGIGTSTSINIKIEPKTNKLLINSLQFEPSGINTNSNLIYIENHGLKTGDKIFYNTSGVSAEGLEKTSYYVFKIDNNKISLCDTYLDSVNNNPNIVNINGVGTTTQFLSLVNPQILSIKNNNLVFNLSDSSLVGYKFKIYYDKNFKKEFISIGNTSSFSITNIGTIGVSSSASLILNYNDGMPDKLYYNVEKSGYISTADIGVSNNSEILFVDSFYNGNHEIVGVGTTTFTFSLSQIPERLTYNQLNCDRLEYSTNSTNAIGGINKIKIESGGYGYQSLPTFLKVDSQFGYGASIFSKSNTIGKIKQFRIINEGFEYSSDKTLKPTASTPKIILISSSNTIDSIEIINGGKNYVTPPNLILVDSDTGELINSGLLRANLQGSSISSILVESKPNGLPTKPVLIRATNNTNGIGIDKVQSSSSGIVTCILTTPIAGFGNAPFSSGEKIYIEGIEKLNEIGDGFNSEDHGYEFFTVSNYTNTNPGILEFNISLYTANPGVAKTIQELSARVIKYNDYPIFNVAQKFSPFKNGEKVIIIENNNILKTDLTILESNQSFIRLNGSFKLVVGQKIKGEDSNSEATIAYINSVDGEYQYQIDFANVQNTGWGDDRGKLNNDLQVISDNDYYQNMSYTVKSSRTWNEIVTPVNNLIHTSGLKNFSDTQFLKNIACGIASTETNVVLINDYISQNRVDTVNNFDLVIDNSILDNISKYLNFNKIKLSDYILCKTNRVLEIDDISSKFNSDTIDNFIFENIFPINSNYEWNKFLVQTRNIEKNEVQFTELILINNDSDIYTLQKGEIKNKNYDIANIIGDVNDDGEFYLRFIPDDVYDSDFEIKIFNNTFLTKVASSSTTGIGFINLLGSTNVISSGISTSILTLDASKYTAIHASVHITNNSLSQMNYVEIYLTHDGQDTHMSEYYFDSQGELSSNFIGTFSSSISNGVLSLNYSNPTNENITVRSKNVGFGTTSIGIGTYRFKLDGQISGTERTVLLESKFTNKSGISTIFSIDKNLFSSAKSTIKIGLGNTSALHQVMSINDEFDAYSTQYPFLSIGSTSGIGTFGAEIDGNNFILKFYPDTSGNIEVLAYNEIFYKDLDSVNIPPSLTYSPVRESASISNYYGINSDQINKLDFETYYERYPIFMKKFNPSDNNSLNLSTGVFTIPNHFFSTGERLIYTPNSTFSGISASSVGIGFTLNYVGIATNILPSVVFAIKDTNNTFRLATRPEYASAGISVTFTSYGSGNAHELEMFKKDEKTIISINNITQYPLSYTSIIHTLQNNGGQISAGSTIFSISGISSISPTDILKIDNEYVKVLNVGIGTTNKGPIDFTGSISLVEVERGVLGSISTTHSDSSTVRIYRGSYTISKNKIFFTDPPRGSLKTYNGSNLDVEKSYFNGRVFLRNDYTTNTIYDNISDQFTGIGQTYILKSQGINTIGLGTDGGNGIVFINNVFQSPSTLNNSNNNYYIVENNTSGISSVIFTGISSSDGNIYTSQFDVNQNQLPRGGIIVSLGSTSGLGYAPLVGASVTAVVGAGGSIVSVGLGTTDVLGSGYRYPVYIEIEDPNHNGSNATINVSVNPGGVLSFSVGAGGTGYVNPRIDISSPNYENLPVKGVYRQGIGQTTETGYGLLLNVDVAARSTTGIGSTLFEVKQFKIVRDGYGFKTGDIFTPVGLVTAKNLSAPINQFEIKVLSTFNDSFAAWQFGELDYIDSIKDYQDGVRTRFPLYYNSSLLSFEIDDNDPDSQNIDFSSLLIIFINGILQKPKDSYQFNGGTSFIFTTPPNPEDNISIYFYRGTVDDDSYLVNSDETIKIGDTLQVFSNNNYIENTITQDPRLVQNIPSSKTAETNLYNGQGVDVNQYKPVYWTKQKSDLLINFEIISKSRNLLESQVYPTAKVIKNFTNSSSEIFLDSSTLFNYENESPINFDAIVISGKPDPVPASIQATVSISGTISSLIVNNPGSGYIGTIVDVKIANPPSISAGIGSTARATIEVVNGSLSGNISITNPGIGYSTAITPSVITPLPEVQYEIIKEINSVQGFEASVVGISTTNGIGTSLAIKFEISRNPFTFPNLLVGYPIYITNTKVGNGVTSINSSDSDIISIGSTCLDNIYYINAFNSTLGIITCNISSTTSVVGIATIGTLNNPVGNLSWGRLAGFTRSDSPISISVTSYSVDVGLSTFPTIQRRGSGLRDTGSLKEKDL